MEEDYIKDVVKPEQRILEQAILDAIKEFQDKTGFDVGSMDYFPHREELWVHCHKPEAEQDGKSGGTPTQ